MSLFQFKNTPQDPTQRFRRFYHYDLHTIHLLSKSLPGFQQQKSRLLSLWMTQYTKESGFWCDILFALPLWNSLCHLIKPDIAFMTAGSDLSLFQGLKDRTATLLHVCAAHKPAIVQIGPELPESSGQLLWRATVSILLERGEPRRIRHHSAVFQPKKLHMTSGMSAPSQFLADLSHGQTKGRFQSVENTGFPNTRITCKGTYLSGNKGG